MKRLLILSTLDLIFFFIAPQILTKGQTWSCGHAMTINHVAGNVAPVTKTVTYGTVTNVPGEYSKCWITSNLGADHTATSFADSTEASAGWYWQFNRMQGYKLDDTTRTPNTTWITHIDENTNWLVTNDPCLIELGNGWRIPTITEWKNVDAARDWRTWDGPWHSVLKMHAAGAVTWEDGLLINRGTNGGYWSRSQDCNSYGRLFLFDSRYCSEGFGFKSGGASIRCIQDEMFNSPAGSRK